MKRFVVTGASGFIGVRLCAALREHGRVTALVRTSVPARARDGVIVADLSRDDISPGVFEGTSCVFHLAGRAHTVADRRDDVDAYTRINVEGTRRVVDAARAAGVRRFVFASSVKAMGEGDGSARMSAYGESKRAAEAVVMQSGIAEPVVLRLSLVYGPGVGGNLGGMLRAVKAGRFPPPPRIENRRAMVHVDDVVRVAIAAGEHRAAVRSTLVIGDGVPYSIRDIYEAMMRALGKPLPAWSLPPGAWRILARSGDVIGAVLGRRAPFDSQAYDKLFGSAWYDPSDVQTMLGVSRLATLSDALPGMVRGL